MRGGMKHKRLRPRGSPHISVKNHRHHHSYHLVSPSVCLALCSHFTCMGSLNLAVMQGRNSCCHCTKRGDGTSLGRSRWISIHPVRLGSGLLQPLVMSFLSGLLSQPLLWHLNSISEDNQRRKMSPGWISKHLSDARHLERNANAKLWTSGERAVMGK